MLDSLGAFPAAANTPAAVRATLDAALGSGVPDDLSLGAVVLAGSARSRPTAVAVDAIASDAVAVPVVTVIGRALPSWVGPGALVVALDLDTAQRLLDDSTVDGVPIIAVGGSATERPNLITETAAALAALDQFGLAGGLIDDMVAACDLLDRRVDELSADMSAAHRLARRIGRTMPLVYGAGPVGAAAAFAWKVAVNRNAKAPSFANGIPGLDHDEVCSWAQHGDVTRQVFTQCMLRHSFETAEEALRMDVTAETMDEIVAGVHSIRTEASTPVGALLDLLLYGEVVSLEMARQADIDPGPTPITERYTA